VGASGLHGTGADEVAPVATPTIKPITANPANPLIRSWDWATYYKDGKEREENRA
jgi:hypothetical protein